MENCLRRLPINQSVSKQLDDTRLDEYQKYKIQTRGEYEELMMEFEFRCRRAAMMNYEEASRNDKQVHRMEVVAALLGTVSMTSVGAWLLNKQTDMSWSSLSQLGAVGAVGLGAALLIEILGKGSSKLIPSFSRRAESHIAAGAAWQKLAQRTRSYRVQLDNPELDVAKYAEWYEDLISQREKICTMVVVPQSTYRLYDDPSKVYKILRRRRKMFLQYLDLETQDLDDFEDNADF